MHGRLRAFVASLALLAPGCGSSPTTPGSFLPPAGGSTGGSISGTVVGYEGRAPLTGATLLFAGVATTTDAAGRFTLGGIPASGTGVITINADGHLFRGVAVTLGTSRTNLTFDLIRDGPPFSLQFFRAFVRNNFESFEMAAIARWTRAPSFYLKTTVETSGVVVPEAVVERIRDVIAKSVPELSGGRFEMAAFETGTATREAEDGWVRITLYPELGAAFGRSTVGGNSGTIDLRYGMVSSPTTNPGGCLTPEVAIIDHEITHTMGFWHTPDVLIDSFSGQGCPGSGRPAHVRYHAAVAYARPVGNRDPDVDPLESAQSSAAAGPRAVVECRFTGR